VRPAFICAAYVVLLIATELLAKLFETTLGPTVWHTPAGLALALLTLLGLRYAPVVLGASLLSSFAFHPQTVWWVQVLLPVLITANHSGVAWLARRWYGPVPVPRNAREAAGLALLTFAAPIPLALVGTGFLQAGGIVAPGLGWSTMFHWWLGAESGILTMVPLIMVNVAPWLLPDPRPRTHQLAGRDWSEIAAQAFALLACLWIVYRIDPLREFHAFYLTFLPLVWICLRRGLPGATLATFAITGGGLAALRLLGTSEHLVVDFLLLKLAVTTVGLGLGTAVTLRFRAEAARAESEARLERVLAGAQLCLWDWEVLGGQMTFNRQWTETLGYQLEELAPRESSWRKLVHSDDLPRVLGVRDAHLKGHTPAYEAEYRLRTKDGGWKWVLDRGSVVERDTAGRPVRVAGALFDIAERKRAEAETLRQLHIVEGAPDYIGTVDLQGNILYANPALLQLRGDTELAAARRRHLSEYHPAWAAQKILREAIPTALAQGQWSGETALLDRQGREMPVSQTVCVHRDGGGRPYAVSTIARDISRQQRAGAAALDAERTALQAHKFESLGMLAGGMAHDFNNLLTAMLGNASLARSELPPASPAHRYFQQIESAALRAAELCQLMLAYSGKGPAAEEAVDLNALAEEIVPELQAEIGTNFVLACALARPLPPANTDPVQLRQAVRHLVRNAVEAIGGRRPGMIRIRTGQRHIDLEFLREPYLSPALAPGAYVFLEVSDDGGGMTPEIQAHLFEPFFTSKTGNHGLGLTAALGFARSHGGAIKAASELGHGSTFTVFLPLLASEISHPAAHYEPAPGWRSAGKLLVIDDEESVCAIATRMLESLGFTPLVAGDGPEGLRLFSEHASSLRAVLLDLSMPRMDGQETFRELRRLDAKVPVILMSGFSEKDLADRFKDQELPGFLQKPFEREKLQACLHGILEARA
jgi:two-component system, cell cycle sensor histidine kinase and response regulator CckA